MTSVTTTTPPAVVNARQGTLFNWLKPRRSVAVARLKSNGFAMVVLLLMTQLAPVVPSPITCLWMLLLGGKGMGVVLRWLCWIELALYAILSANIVQSYIGLRYPPPPSTRPVKGLTPIKLSQKKTTLSSSYSSPVSTPSRVANYKGPLTNSSSYSSSPFQTPLNSSFSTSLLSSPLGYRARQPHAQSVRSMRASLLHQLEADDDDEF